MWLASDLSLPEIIVGLGVRSVVLLTVALTVIWFMRRASAAQRHIALALTATALLALPPITLVVPSWNLGLFPAPFKAATFFTAYDARILPEPSHSPDAARATSRGPSRATDAAGVPSTRTISSPRWLRWMVIGWAVVAGPLLLFLVASRMFASWIAQRSPPVDNANLLNALESVSEQLGVTRPVTLASCDFFKVPFVSGLVKPRIIVPPEASRWPFGRLRAILFHELAHVRRRDALTQLVAQLACCLYWFNPLAWIMERRLFLERERACDDAALEADIQPADYAGHLMEVMEEMGNQRDTLWVTAAMAEGTDFKDRILSVLDPAARRTQPRLSYTLFVGVFTLLLLIPLAAITPWAASADHGAGQITTVDGASPGRVAGGDEQPQTTGDSDQASAIPRELDESAVAALIESLRSPSAGIREHSATALGRLRETRAVPALIDTLGDDDPKVREHCASALGTIGDDRATESLSALLLRDREERVREHAASALGEIGDRRAVESLAEALRDDTSPRVREHAALALGSIGGLEVVGPLSDALRDTSERVRLRAAKALSMIENEP